MDEPTFASPRSSPACAVRCDGHIEAGAWVGAGQGAQHQQPRHEPQIGVRFAGIDKLVHLIDLGEAQQRWWRFSYCWVERIGKV